MAAAITDIDVTESAPNAGLKKIFVQTRADVDDTDTIAIVLADYGISPTGLLTVHGWVHSTASSIIIAEEPTTAVATGTLTITVGGSTDNKVRVYEVIGRAIPNVTT